MNNERVRFWLIPIDTRYKSSFKIRDSRSVQLFIEQTLRENEYYTIKDLNDKTMYYTIILEETGRLSLGHTKYGNGILPPILMTYDNIPQRIFKARKSFNEYFFKRDE